MIFKRKDNNIKKAEEAMKVLQQMQREAEDAKRYGQGIKNILIGATISLGEIYEIDNETTETFKAKTEEELLKILEESIIQLDKDIKEEKKVMTRWKLRKLLKIMDVSTKKARIMLEEEIRKEALLRERIAIEIMKLDMLEITNERGEPETREGLINKTSEQLMKMLEEGLTELEKIVGKTEDGR